MEGVATESCAVQSILSSSERPGEKEKEKEQEEHRFLSRPISCRRFVVRFSRKAVQTKWISNVRQLTQLDCVTQFSLPNQNMPLHDHKKGQGNIATCCPQQKSVAQSMCDHIRK